MSKVVIKFLKGGKTETKVEGVPGGDCRVASRGYLEALTGKVTSDNPTDEAYMPENATVRDRLGQG